MDPFFQPPTLILTGAVLTTSTTGRVLTIKTATLPVTVILNGGTSQLCPAGTVLHLPAGVSNQITFKNANAANIQISYWFADDAVPFSANDYSQALAATVLEGDLNIPPSSAAGAIFTNSPASDANGYLKITNGMAFKVAGQNSAGHRRQYITLTMAPTGTSAFNLLVADINGNVAMVLVPGAQIGLPLDSDIYLSGSGGTAFVAIGQHFLTQ